MESNLKQRIVAVNSDPDILISMQEALGRDGIDSERREGRLYVSADDYDSAQTAISNWERGLV